MKYLILVLLFEIIPACTIFDGCSLGKHELEDGLKIAHDRDEVFRLIRLQPNATRVELTDDDRKQYQYDQVFKFKDYQIDSIRGTLFLVFAVGGLSIAEWEQSGNSDSDAAPAWARLVDYYHSGYQKEQLKSSVDESNKSLRTFVTDEGYITTIRIDSTKHGIHAKILKLWGYFE